MKFYSADDVHRLLDYDYLVAGLKRMHREDMDGLDRLTLSQPDHRGDPSHFLLLPAWQRNQAIGVKLVTVFANNDPQVLPAVQAIYVLFDGKNGEPQALIDGTALTLRKTAADSALGSRMLARSDVAVMLMVGAGALAPHLIQAHLAVRPSIEEVLVWNRTPARAQALVENLSLPGHRLGWADDLAAAARRADLISCATMARSPLIQGKWLKAGCHLDLVGGYTPDMREADDAAMAEGRVFVDARRFTVEECGDIMAPLASGVISMDDILADHYDLCRGRHPGRQSNSEITVMKNGGGGHLDLMTARLLRARDA